MKFAIVSLLFIAVAVGVQSSPQEQTYQYSYTTNGGGDGGIQTNVGANANVGANIDLGGAVGGATALSGNIVSQLGDILGGVLGANGAGSITRLLQLLINAAVKGTPINAVLGSLGNILGSLNAANLNVLPANVLKQIEDLIASTGILPRGLIRALLQLINTIIRGLKAGQAIPEILKAASGILGGLNIGGLIGGKGNCALNLNSILEQIRQILLTILSPRIVNVVINLIEALLCGRPISGIINQLESVLKSLTSGDLIPGATGTVKGLAGMLLGPKASNEQIIEALNKIQAALSNVLKPSLVKIVIDLLKRLLSGGPINGLLSSVKNILGGLTGGASVGGGVNVGGGVTAALNLKDALEQIRAILKTILSPELVDIVIDLVEAILTGRPIGPIVKRLVSILKSLVNKHGLVPGLIGVVKGLLSSNPKVSKAQIIRALNQIRIVLSRIANPKIINAIIRIIYALCLGGPLGGVLKSLGGALGGLLGGLLGPKGLVGGLLGPKGLVGGLVGPKGAVGGLLGGLGLGGILGGATGGVGPIPIGANVGAKANVNIGY